MGKQWPTLFLGSKITTRCDCSHEIKRCLLLGRKVMTNLDSILKSRDITLFNYLLCTCVSVFFFFYFNWRLITLQYCGGFCHTFTWISHGCTCVPHPDPSSHLPPHPIPQSHPSAPALSTLSHASKLDWRSVSHMLNIHVSMLFSQIIPPAPFPIESNSLFFISVSLLLSLKSRYITLPTKVCIVKVMVFPVVMYGCESWTYEESWTLKN